MVYAQRYPGYIGRDGVCAEVPGLHEGGEYSAQRYPGSLRRE